MSADDYLIRRCRVLSRLHHALRRDDERSAVLVVGVRSHCRYLHVRLRYLVTVEVVRTTVCVVLTLHVCLLVVRVVDGVRSVRLRVVHVVYYIYVVVVAVRCCCY